MPQFKQSYFCSPVCEGDVWLCREEQTATGAQHSLAAREGCRCFSPWQCFCSWPPPVLAELLSTSDRWLTVLRPPAAPPLLSATALSQPKVRKDHRPEYRPRARLAVAAFPKCVLRHCSPARDWLECPHREGTEMFPLTAGADFYSLITLPCSTASSGTNCSGAARKVRES